jgi:hypothetical protein
MSYKTDARFNASRFAPARGKASAEARRVAKDQSWGNRATEFSRSAHAASDKKMQYDKAVIVRREPTARG